MSFSLFRPTFRQILLFLLFVWIISFPVKGVSYQLSLYLLPVLVVAMPQTRSILLEMRRELLFLTMCLALPLFLSDSRAFFFWGDVFSKDPFHAFWRLSLFPLILVTVCRYCDVNPLTLRKWCVLFFSFYALFACFYFFSGWGHGWRESGFVHNPNPFGVLMASGALLAFIGLFQCHRRYEIYLNVLALSLLSFGVVLSGSRSAWLGGGMACLISIFFLRHTFFRLLSTRKGKVVLAFGFIALTVIFFFFMDTRLEHYVSSRIGRVFEGDIRLQIWQGYLAVAEQYPLLGRPMSPERKVVVNGAMYGPHNMYLSIFIEAGLIGFVGLVFVLFWLGWRGFHLFSSLRIAPLTLLSLLCIYCFFNSSFFGHVMTQGLFALIVAFILIPAPNNDYI